MCEVRVSPVALLSNLKASKGQLDHLCFKLSFPLLSASTLSHFFKINSSEKSHCKVGLKWLIIKNGFSALV